MRRGWLMIGLMLAMLATEAAQAEPMDAVRVEVPGKFAYPVVQQSDRDDVPESSGVVAQYILAKKWGVIGFLAHDYLAGAKFYDLAIGDAVRVTFADGSVEMFAVSYKRTLAFDAVADFDQTFFRGSRHVTFQTCWGTMGVLMVMAQPAAIDYRPYLPAKREALSIEPKLFGMMR